MARQRIVSKETRISATGNTTITEVMRSSRVRIKPAVRKSGQEPLLEDDCLKEGKKANFVCGDCKASRFGSKFCLSGKAEMKE